MFALQSCLTDEIGTSNQDIFQYIWDELDQNYGGFAPREIDWDSVYRVYITEAISSETELEIFEICSKMIDILDDQHVSIISTNLDTGFASGKEFDEVIAEKEFEIEIIKSNYIEDFTTIIADDEGFIYGRIKNEHLGYIYIPNFRYNESKWHERIDDAVNFLQNTNGLILDVRNNGGGTPAVDRYMAGRFIAEEKLLFSIQTRNGPDHTDFDAPTYYYSNPKGNLQYTNPTIVLTNHSTVSAGEEFVLFLETQSHITVVGDSTSNAFSTVTFDRLLPNGWELSYPNQLYLYPDGSSPEGIGIVPDIYIRNNVPDVQNGIDRVLEKAIEMF